MIPNGVDTATWQSTGPAREDARRRWSRHGPLLVFSGRLEAEGIFTLLDAMPHILAAHPRARLVVSGQGGQSGRFDQVTAERGLSDAVVRAGWQPEADLRALIAASDIAIVPSLYEPFGLVALEAMALGAPVICARTGGLADIVTDGETGLLFSPAIPVTSPERCWRRWRTRRRRASARIWRRRPCKSGSTGGSSRTTPSMCTPMRFPLRRVLPPRA